MPQTKFREWRRMRARIEADQIGPLDRHVAVFRLFQQTLRDAQIPKRSSLGLVTNWMVLNYIVFAAAWIRKAADRRTDSISLVRLLEDLKAHAHLLTRERFRRMFRRHGVPERLIHVQWERHFGRGHTVSSKVIARDIRRLERKTASTRKLTNKLVAHTEKDRRKWPKVVLGRIREASEAVIETHHKYNILLCGQPYQDDLVEEDKAAVAEVFATLWRAAAADPSLIGEEPTA